MGTGVVAKSAVPGTARRRTAPTWSFSAGFDLAVGLCWVPVFLVAHVLDGLPGATGATFLRDGVVVALLVSFAHQPLTFGLVYGDAGQFRLHRRLFVLAPLVAVAAAAAGAFANLSVVIPIAALWNLQHTLQQRYGIQRIYAGRAGYGSARLDRAFAYVPMVAALAAVAASRATAGLVARSGLDPMNAGAAHLLVSIRPAATALALTAAAASLAVVVAVLRQEAAAGERANPAKWLYQLSFLALLGGLVVDPAAGFIAYVSAHAIEYAVVVDRTAKRRYGSAGAGGEDGRVSFLGKAARSAAGRVAFFAAIAALAVAVHETLGGPVLNTVVYSVGALHFTFDAVIWKLRKPALKKDFRIPLAGAVAR